MRCQDSRTQRQQQTQHGNPQHGRLDGVAGQAQIQPSIKQNETDKQANGCLEPLSQVQRLHKAEARTSDQQS